MSREDGKLMDADTCRNCLFHRYSSGWPRYRSHHCDHPMCNTDLPEDCVTMICYYWRQKLEEK